MPRTDATAVGAIIEVDEDISVTPFIEAANALVTEICEPVAAYDATRLELIERWLAAHFYALRDPRAKQEQAGTVGQTLHVGWVRMHLQSTLWGQQAMLLDTAGGLARLNKGIETGKRGGTVGVTYLGTTPVLTE